MTSPAWPIAEAVVAALAADATLAAFIGRADYVYGDAPPLNTPTPYVTMASADEQPDDTFATRGFQDALDLHLWGGTREQVLVLYQHIVRILDATSLTVSGVKRCIGRTSLVTVISDPTGLAHGVAVYRVRTQSAA